MLAVGLDEDQARAIAAPHGGAVTIAAFNGPRSLTLSGPRISLETIARDLEEQSVFARLVRVDHPFHHALMQPAAEALEKALADLAPKQETIPFFSTVTGGRQRDWGSISARPHLFSGSDAVQDRGSPDPGCGRSPKLTSMFSKLLCRSVLA